MLPVLAYRDWQVEPVLVDRGTGMREWLEVRHRDHVFYCADHTELCRLLDGNGLLLDDFAEIEPEDGCE